ncbi:MAG: hypothetical protein QW597_00670 [Thermoplasmataceae archaeon]
MAYAEGNAKMTDQKPPRHVSDIDKRLTMQFDISFLLKDRISEETRKLGITAPGFTYYHSDRIELFFYLPPSIEQLAEGKRAITMMKAKNRNNTWIVRCDITDRSVIDTIESLVAIPSVVIDMVLMDKGSLKIRFRFHHNFIKNASDILLSKIGTVDALSINYFGESRGIASTIIEQSSRIHLSAIKFTMEPNSLQFDETNEIFSQPWMRVRKYDSGGQKLHHVYFFYGKEFDPKKYNLKTISKEDSLYETNSENPVLVYLVSECEKLGLFSDSIHIYNGKVLLGRVWIPSAFVPDYVGLIASARAKFPDWNIEIGGVTSMEDVFEPSFDRLKH